MSEKSKGQETLPNGKEKLSRVSRYKRRKSRKIRRFIVFMVLAVGALLAVGAVFNIPFVNVARRGGEWLGDRMSSTEEEGAEKELPDYEFLSLPGSGETQTMVETLLVLYREDLPQRTILGLALLAYDAENERGEFYLVPEDTAVFNLEGRQVALRDILEEEGGYDLLRSTIANMSGGEVDYTMFLDFRQAVLLLQALDSPTVTLEEDTVLVNPLNGETSHLIQGQLVEDADRLIFYFLATDQGALLASRVDRLRDYLPAFSRG